MGAVTVHPQASRLAADRTPGRKQPRGLAIVHLILIIDPAGGKRLPDGTMVSPPLEDLTPFLSEEEMNANMIVPRMQA